MTEETLTKVEITKLNSANVSVKNTDASCPYTIEGNVDVNNEGKVTNFNGNVYKSDTKVNLAFFSGNGANFNFNYYNVGKEEMCEISSCVSDFIDNVAEHIGANPLNIV